MAIQKVEFEFPDPDKVADKTDFVERDDGSFVLKVEGPPEDEAPTRHRAQRSIAYEPGAVINRRNRKRVS